MIFSEGKGVNPLFFQINSSGNHVSLGFPFWGNLSPFRSQAKDRLFEDKTFHRPMQVLCVKPTRDLEIKKVDVSEKTPNARPNVSSKAKDLSRWEMFAKHILEEKQTLDMQASKTVWNYFLGQCKCSDWFSYDSDKHKENLQMVVEPNQTGITLYVFWKAEGLGPFGIFFYYEPEKENPIRVELVTESSPDGRNSWEDTNLSKEFLQLLRDFPQLERISFEEWKHSSYNGDYR